MKNLKLALCLIGAIAFCQIADYQDSYLLEKIGFPGHRISMHHQFQSSFVASNGSSFSTNMYTNVLNYQISDHWRFENQIGLTQSTFLNTTQKGFPVLWNSALVYDGENDFHFRLSFSNHRNLSINRNPFLLIRTKQNIGESGS